MVSTQKTKAAAAAVTATSIVGSGAGDAPASSLRVNAATTGDPSDGEVALQHVIMVVLRQSKDGPLAKALERSGISEIFDILLLNQSDRDSLTFKDEDGLLTPLSVGHKNMLKALKMYSSYCMTKGTPIDDWTEVTKEAFDFFRCSDACFNATEFDITPVAAAPKHDPLNDFRKGIKRDASLFTILKDPKQWDSWHRSTMAQARAQDVSEVLDPSFVPSQSEGPLFEAKQKYLYAVFERVLQTDKGKALLQAYEDEADAQQIFKELCEDALQSTCSSIDSSRLLSYITSVRIGDGHWNGSSHSFILHWQEQVRLYESLVDSSAHFNSGQKMHMLQNAVHPLQELHQVKNQADQLQAFHGKTMKYESYCNLLLSAASNYDAQFVPKTRSEHLGIKSAKREVYSHDLQDGIEDSYDSTLYNLDSSVVELQANLHDQHNKSLNKAPHLSGQQWRSLHPDARATWDLLPDDAKAIILGTCKAPGKRSVNLHEISAFDFIQANLHDMQMGSNHDPDNPSPAPDESPKDDANSAVDDGSIELLAFLTKQQPPTHPGHLASVLSTSMSKSSQGGKFLNKPHSCTPSPPKGNEIVVNGKKYWQVNTHKIHYSVSAHQSRNAGSLVDHGANGGIAGNDVCIIEKSDQTVNVSGIDNHQIIDISIVITGGLVKPSMYPSLPSFTSMLIQEKARQFILLPSWNGIEMM